MFERALKIGDVANIPITLAAYVGAGLYVKDWLSDQRVGISWQVVLIMAVVLIGLASVALQFIGLIWPTWRWRSSTAVESPLEWYNGVLRWKEGRLKQVASKEFRNQEVPLDGIEYIDCSFDGVTFVYKGTGKTSISGNCVIHPRPDGKPNVRFHTDNLIVGTTVLILEGLQMLRDEAKRRIESIPLDRQ
jgi:hypothetical protein